MWASIAIDSFSLNNTLKIVFCQFQRAQKKTTTAKFMNQYAWIYFIMTIDIHITKNFRKEILHSTAVVPRHNARSL